MTIPLPAPLPPAVRKWLGVMVDIGDADAGQLGSARAVYELLYGLCCEVYRGRLPRAPVGAYFTADECNFLRGLASTQPQSPEDMSMPDTLMAIAAKMERLPSGDAPRYKALKANTDRERVRVTDALVDAGLPTDMSGAEGIRELAGRLQAQSGDAPPQAARPAPVDYDDAPTCRDTGIRSHPWPAGATGVIRELAQLREGLGDMMGLDGEIGNITSHGMVYRVKRWAAKGGDAPQEPTPRQRYDGLSYAARSLLWQVMNGDRDGAYVAKGTAAEAEARAGGWIVSDGKHIWVEQEVAHLVPIGEASRPPGDPRPPAPAGLETRIAKNISQVQGPRVPPGGAEPDPVRRGCLAAEACIDTLKTDGDFKTWWLNLGGMGEAHWHDKMAHAVVDAMASEGAAPPIDPGAWTLSTLDSEPGQAGNVTVSRARWDLLVQAAADAGNEPGEDGHTADGFISEVCNLLTFVDKGAAPPPQPEPLGNSEVIARSLGKAAAEHLTGPGYTIEPHDGAGGLAFTMTMDNPVEPSGVPDAPGEVDLRELHREMFAQINDVGLPAGLGTVRDWTLRLGEAVERCTPDAGTLEALGAALEVAAEHAGLRKRAEAYAERLERAELRAASKAEDCVGGQEVEYARHRSRQHAMADASKLLRAALEVQS